MTHEEFMTGVQQRAQLGSRADAEQLTGAVLEALAESLSGNEARDLASQLPGELEQHLTQGQVGQSRAVTFSREDFLMRVANREEIDVSLAEQRASAVMRTVQEAVTGGQIDHIRSQLGPEFDTLFN